MSDVIQLANGRQLLATGWFFSDAFERTVLGRPYIVRMRFRLALLLVLSLLAVASCPVCASDLALTGARVYPSPTDPAIQNGSILIHDGHIVAVGPSQSIKVPHICFMCATRAQRN